MTDLRKVADTLEMTIPYLPAKTATLSEVEDTIEELRQALAQPEQEPVAWMTHTDRFMPLFHKTRESALNWQTQPTPIPIYTAPPKREWKGLTSDDKHFLLANAWNKEQAFDGFMGAIDKFLEEKNT